MDKAEVRAEKFAQIERLHGRIFALADEIVANHPEIVD